MTFPEVAYIRWRSLLPFLQKMNDNVISSELCYNELNEL